MISKPTSTLESAVDALINAAPQKSAEEFAQESLALLFEVSEYLGDIEEQLEAMQAKVAEYERVLSFIEDWPTKLFPGNVTAYAPMVIHEQASQALQRGSNSAMEPESADA